MLQWLPGYVLGLLISGVAALVTRFLAQRFPVVNLEGVLLMAGIVAVALTWGVGPSLLATLVGTWLLAFVVLPPHFSWQLQAPSKGMEILVLLLGGGGISVLASQSARGRRRAEAGPRGLRRPRPAVTWSACAPWWRPCRCPSRWSMPRNGYWNSTRRPGPSGGKPRHAPVS